MSASHCGECGAPLAPELNGACPACLWGEADEAVTLPDLRIGEEIARGGMGVVYRAWQLQPAREVAAKMLLPRLLDEPGIRERFANEVKVAASLEHPAILPVYAVGECGMVPYFTMKLAAGGSLADRLRARGALPPREAAALMADIAGAMDYAHRRGVLHRDLKPGNILFDADGRVYVSDFGLARVVNAGAADLTRTIAILGTPHYLPPEIAGGSMRDASTAGDIYALGAVLHELLSGAPPFAAETVPGLLRRIADDEAVLPASLPADLRAIPGKCMDKEPARRYSTAGALEEDLRAWLAGRPVKARRPGPVERTWRWARRNPVVAALAAGLAAAIAIGLAAEFRARARLSESLADSQLARAALVRRDLSGGARSGALELVRQSAALTPHPAADRAARLRGEAAAALALPSLKRVSQWKVPGNWNLVSPAFTADLDRFAAPAESGGCAVFDTATGQAVHPLTTSAGAGVTPALFAFAAGGQTVAATGVSLTTGRSTTEVYALDGIAPRLLGRFEAGGLRGAVPVLFSDGRFIAAAADGSLLTGRGADSMVPLALPVENARIDPHSLTLSHDGQRLCAALDAPPGLAVWTLTGTGVRRGWQRTLSAVPQCLAWSRDDTRLAFADSGTAPVSLTIADSGTGRTLAGLPGHGSAVAGIAFHPAGDSVASVGFDNWLVWQSTAPGGFRVRLPGNPGPLAFTPDGKRLGYSPARGSLATAEVALPEGWRLWPASSGLGTITCAETTADGRRLVLATLEGLALWDAENGRRLELRPWTAASVRWPWFRLAPGGRFLVCGDSNVPITRWPVLDSGFGEPKVVPSPRPGPCMIQDFTADGRDWLVSADREQREASAFTNFYLWPGGDPARARLIAAGARANGLALVPPGAQLAIGYHSHQPDARLWDCATAREIRSLGHAEPVVFAVNSDGRRVCTVGAAEGCLWDCITWTRIAVWSQEERGKTAPVFIPDSSMVATATAAGHVSVRRASGGTPFLELAPPRDLTAPELRWLGNSRLLLASALDGLHEWNLETLRAAAAREGIPW